MDAIVEASTLRLLLFDFGLLRYVLLGRIDFILEIFVNQEAGEADFCFL